MGAFHVRDGVICDSILCGKRRIRQGVGENLHIPGPGGVGVPAIVPADDLVGFCVVYICAVPPVRPACQRDRTFRVYLIHAGGQLDRFRIGEISVRCKGRAGTSVDQAAIVGGLHVLIVPGAGRHVRKGNRRGQGGGEDAYGYRQGEHPGKQFVSDHDCLSFLLVVVDCRDGYSSYTCCRRMCYGFLSFRSFKGRLICCTPNDRQVVIGFAYKQ